MKRSWKRQTGVGLLLLFLTLSSLHIKSSLERVLPTPPIFPLTEWISKSKRPGGGVSNGIVATDAPGSIRKPNMRLGEIFSVLNHNPIEFYGRAVDQFGVPVVEAEVTGDVLYNTGASSGMKAVRTLTDVDGYFQFSGIDGQSLGIGFEKSGYEFNPRNTLFWYSYFEADHKRHQPARERPVVFILWKKQGAEFLIHYRQTWRFPVNAGSIRLNLETGEVDGTESDLIVTVTRDPLRMRFGQRGFAWKAMVEVVQGGLIRIGPSDYYNLAPETGYQPQFEHVQEAQDLHVAPTGRLKWTWREDVSDDFFISSREGRDFAHVTLCIRPNSDHQEGDNEALVEATIWLNPHGSRNLEFDPGKEISRPRK